MMWWRTPVHPTWQLTALCFGILGGVVLTPWWTHGSWLLLLPAGVLIAITALEQWRLCLIGVFAAGLMLGLVRGGIEWRQQYYYANFFGKRVTVTGTITEDPNVDQDNRHTIKINDVILKNHSLPGVVWVSIQGDTTILQRGDRITVTGQVNPGFGSFVATLDHVTIQKIERQQGDIALYVRDWFARHIQQTLHDPAADLGSGFVLGQKHALSSELQESLRTVGLTHVVVASGYNLTILVRLARRLFAKKSRYLAVLSSVSLVFCFVAIAGLSPSMVRAGLVSLFGIWAWAYGRVFHPVTLLTLVASITVLYNPWYAWGDLGWQLSFAAFAGVMILAPLLQSYFFGSRRPSIGRQILGETLSAQIMTLPISLVAFGQLSLVALPANLLIVPLVPLAMLLTFMAGLITALIPVASILSLPAQWLLDAMIWVIQRCALLPWAQIDYKLQWWGVILYYGGLVAICWWLRCTTGNILRKSSVVE